MTVLYGIFVWLTVLSLALTIAVRLHRRHQSRLIHGDQFEREAAQTIAQIERFLTECAR